MVFCFVVDSSSFPSPSSPHGSASSEHTSISHLDTVKCAIEKFLTSYPSSGRLPVENSLLLIETGSEGTRLLCPLHRDQRIFDAALKNITSSSSVPPDLSAAFRFTCNLLNKYRTAGNIGNIGRGRLPWSIQPTIIVLLTSPSSLFAESNQSFVRHILHEREDGQLLLEDSNCLRWDDRYFILSVGPPQPPSTTEATRNACHAVGGEFLQCHDWKSAISAAKNLASLASYPTVILDIGKNGYGELNRCLMQVKGVGAWPLPEDSWIHRNLDTLPSRRPYPLLRIRAVRGKISLFDMLNQCAQLTVPVDSYEIAHMRPLDGVMNEWYGVYVSGSAREGTTEIDTPLCGAYNPAQLTLCVLPYDFPTLLSLIHKAKTTPITSQWKSDMDNYMNRIPLYYHASVLQLLKKLKLAPASVAAPTVDAFLSKNVQRRVSRHQTTAQNEIQILGSQSTHMQNTTSAPYPPLDDLLHIWDTMRRCIYGGEGLTTSGLYLKNRPRNTSGGYVSSDAKNDMEEDWFFKAVGATRIPQVEIRNMGDFTRVLASREVHRDPENLTPPPDEGSPQEILRRKLSIHFGNPYASSKKPSKGKRGKQHVLRLEGDEQDVESVAESEVEYEQDYEDEATLAFASSSSPQSASSDSPTSFSSDSSNCSRPMLSLGESRAKKKARLQQQQEQKHQESVSPIQPIVPEPPVVESDLPPGWIKRFSEKHKCEYWFNTTTGKSQWEPPSSK